MSRCNEGVSWPTLDQKKRNSMKHWNKIDGRYFLAADEEKRVVMVKPLPDGEIIKITDQCDRYFSVSMHRHCFIEALRELADHLEAVEKQDV